MTGSKYIELNSNLDYGEYDVVNDVFIKSVASTNKVFATLFTYN